MTIERWLLASLHLVALGIGLGAIVVRAHALRGTLDGSGVRRVLAADTAWGVAALLWISTGLVRAFSSLEKGSDYYLANIWFWHKMAFLVLILALEISPMVAFIRWRNALRRGVPVDTGRATTFSRISAVQAVLVVAMVFAATAMARGLDI